MQILTTLLDIVTAFLRLLETEGKILKRAVMNLGWALAFVGVASVLVLAAAGFFLTGIYQYLAVLMSSAAASLLVSLLAFVLALTFAGIAKWRVK
ncbi:MAG: hypothetical protein M1591_07220 [Deltaproteobacteria bacterium]|nr:hypothetical protein [Deltaproteobacteria bacterium]